MANRKIQDEVQTIFDKYTTGFARRLKRHDATTMLEKEFSLNTTDADVVFELFDKDKNNELSLWEFQQFYTCMGTSASDTIKLFQKLESSENSGTIDIEKCWDSMKTMKYADGKDLQDKDIEMLIMSTAGAEKSIDLPKFITLMTRIKFFKG